jgi:hypothetical protein
LDCGISVIITFELVGRVVTGVSTMVCVPVAVEVGAGGTGVPSLVEVHPAPRTNRIQKNPNRVPIKIFWRMVKNGGEQY